MNYIDEKFYGLIYTLKEKDTYDIYAHMVSGFKKIPLQTQRSVESFFNQFQYWGKIDIDNDYFECFDEKAKIFKNHIDDYIWLYEHLCDYRSKHLLYAILNNYYNFDFTNLQYAQNFAFKQYFDLDLVPKCENEVFVDIGAYTGDSVLAFISSYGEKSYEKIYCYDITEEIFTEMQKNLQKYHKIEYKNTAVTNFVGEIGVEANSFSSSANMTSLSSNKVVEATTLDNDIQEKITMIKMDIEGGEGNALLGAKNHIKQDLPKLFISVYHNNTHLFEIPKLIYSITHDYDFYLRYYGGCIYPTEIVLICLPKNS